MSFRTLAWLFIVGVIVVGTQRCATLNQRPPPPALNVTGFWEGRSMGICSARSRCVGMVLISLAMIQNESSITGMYRCATGNVTCRALNSRGQIVMGQIRGPGVSLRVMFEDVSSCIFNGTFNNETGSGAYICMLSVGIERGVWQVKRAQQPS